jgi:WD40 repeat protein
VRVRVCVCVCVCSCVCVRVCDKQRALDVRAISYHADDRQRLQHPCFVYCARFHPPKGAPAAVITGAYDGVLRVWNLATRQVTELLGHSSSINAIELDASGVKVGFVVPAFSALLLSA